MRFAGLYVLSRCVFLARPASTLLENAIIGPAWPDALVAQLDRASDFDSEGREFESLRARH